MFVIHHIVTLYNCVLPNNSHKVSALGWNRTPLLQVAFCTLTELLSFNALLKHKESYVYYVCSVSLSHNHIP
jgi:hypothetical protein